MTDNHPITPPSEMVQEWLAEIWYEGTPVRVAASDLHITTQAARWGADQELEACCEWLASETPEPYINALRLARRPKPKSEGLSEEALKELDWLESVGACNNTVIRRALKRLQELEGQANG